MDKGHILSDSPVRADRDHIPRDPRYLSTRERERIIDRHSPLENAHCLEEAVCFLVPHSSLEKAQGRSIFKKMCRGVWKRAFAEQRRGRNRRAEAQACAEQMRSGA